MTGVYLGGYILDSDHVQAYKRLLLEGSLDSATFNRKKPIS